MRTPLLLSILFLLFSCSSTVEHIENDVDISLDNEDGYLLIGIDLNKYVNRPLHSIVIEGERDFILTHEDMRYETNYFLLPVPAGNYEIEKIRFSKMYRLELTSGYWNFSVNPGEISYIGHLELSNRGGWFSSSRVELQNRSSAALLFMQETFPNILQARSLRYRGPGQDDFLKFVDTQEVQDVSDE